MSPNLARDLCGFFKMSLPDIALSWVGLGWSNKRKPERKPADWLLAAEMLDTKDSKNPQQLA
jgi:hypothetical protein